MKTLTVTVILFFTLAQFVAASGRDFYQIQVYHLSGKAQEQSVDKYLKFSYLPALHRAGIKTVGVFKPVVSDTTSGKQIIVWIPLTSLGQLDKLQHLLAKDAIYQTSGADFLKAPYDQVPFQRKEAILLKAFPDAPKYSAPKFATNPAERIYELRSYEGPTEYLFRQKVKMFNEGGEIKLFKTLDFNAVFYAEVISGSVMPNLMYMTTFADMSAHDAHWKSFSNHPDWKKLSSLSEYQHTVSRIIKILLSPTDYSDF
jgi:hypothetical protein